MSITPTVDSWLAWPLYNLRVMLSESPTLQAWGGDADETAALDRIHLFAIGDSTKRWFDFAGVQVLLDWGSDFGADREATLTSAEWLPRGQVIVAFQEFMADLDADDPELDMADKVGRIVNDLAAIAGNAGRLSIHDFQIEGFNRNDPADANGYDIIDLFGTMRFIHPHG